MIRGYVGSFLSLAGVACGLTWLYLGMRSVMEIGGSCASGGPYEIAQPCPEGVPFFMLGGIFGGLICLGLFIAFSSKLGGDYGSLVLLGWPALFLSLGWNFLEFGLDPPGPDGGPVWGWLFCAVLFAAMGGLPLLPMLKPSAVKSVLWPTKPKPDAFGRKPAQAVSAVAAVREAVTPAQAARRRAERRGTGAVNRPVPRQVPAGVGAGDDGDDVVDQLERLAALRDRGALDAEEYERAKKAVLDG